MASDSTARDQFIRWQCRVRQDAMRRLAGRPSEAMRPRVLDPSGNEILPAMIVLLVPHEPANDTALFRFQVQKNAEPQKRYEAGLKHLQADYFQLPEVFGEVLTAQFAPQSPAAARLSAAGRCRLEFAQFSQSWSFDAGVTELMGDDPARQHTLWHNRLFNPQVSNEAVVLAFTPDWNSAVADPKLPA